MTHIVLENCIKCKFTDCVSVCPVDCFYEGKNFLVINTEDCIDCAVCVPECPINAIKNYNENLINHNLFYKINSNFSKIWPNIIKNVKNTENNLKWNNIKNKLHLIKL